MHDSTDYKVVDGTPVAPLYMKLQGKPSVDLVMESGPTLSLMKYAASDGYRLVPESIQNILHQALPQYDAHAASTMLPEEVLIVPT